ncbi:MAG: AarF/UbiB family protein [Desulforhopalus sp.]
MQFSDIKKLKRFKDIVVILAKYGFDEVVDQLDVPGADFLHTIVPVDKNLGLFERIRIVIEELGPTFIKFGQIMSLRPDLLPDELLTELEKLQDDVPAVESKDILPVIEQCLGKSITEVFSQFDVKPIAAASLSQVHKGILRENGTVVAVKVQRPNIIEDITSDLDILESISRFLDQQFDELQCYDLPKLVATVRRNLMQELDFTQELNNFTIARSYAEQTDVYIPATYEKLSSKRLLVMEFFEGVKFKELSFETRQNREQIAIQGLQTIVQQILEDGFFHADPHPGNLLVSSDMSLCIIDWGMVGRLTERDRFMLIEMLTAVVDKNSEALSNIFLQLCHTRNKRTQRNALERDLLALLDRFSALPIADMDMGGLLRGLLALLRDNNLQLPTDMVIMIKSLVTAEGSARLVYPELNVVEELRGSVHRLALERYKPGVIWRGLKNSFANFLAVKSELPRQLLQIIDKIEGGELSFNFHLEKLENLVTTLENASNRLTIGIITGSIIMGSSMIITTGVGPFIFGLPALGVTGYLLSVVLGLWLVITILRKNKF